MNFLLISADGDGLGIAMRLKDEGHNVTVFVKNPKAQYDYGGLLARVADPMSGIFAPDTIVVFDSTGFGKLAEKMRGEGIPVIGGSLFADKLELDRAFGLGVMEDCGILVPESKHFNDWPSAIAYAEARPERMALKSGGEIPSTLSDSPEQMVELLKFYEKAGEKADFELQCFVKGLEISSEGWFDGQQFARPFNHTFERKQMMNGNLGGSHGCAGNVVFACPHNTCRICQEGIARLAPILRAEGYVGMIDLNAIVNKDGIWGLEWTPRFGYDGFPALMEMLTCGLGEILAKYAHGERVPEFPMALKGYGSGLRVSIPPCPTDEESYLAAKGLPIGGLTRNDRVHSFFFNVMLSEDDKLVTSGAWGEIACFTGLGDTIDTAMTGPLEIASRLELPDKGYRTDLTSVFMQCAQEFESECRYPANEEIAERAQATLFS